MFVDTHLHTVFSTDSRMTMEEVLETVQKKNIGFTITEHMDFLYPLEKRFVFDVDAYFNTYQKFRTEKCLLGIEIGMRLDCIEMNKKLIESYSFDYVLGSIHMVNGEDVFQSSFYNNSNKKEKYAEYLKTMLDCIEQYDFIDSMAHIDYVSRYAPYEDTELYYAEFSKEIDAVLKILAKRGKALEINTRRLGDKQVALNLKPIYKRFAELGGRYVTLGSDAHAPLDIARNFKEGIALAKECDLEIVYFQERALKVSK